MPDNLLNFYNLTSTELSSAIIVFNILLAFGCAAVVVWVYRLTHRGLSYSQSFLVTLFMVGGISSVVMMVVQQNIVGAFALLGAFSLIRFRTIVKDTKDVAFVFFSLVEGVAVGTNNYAIAVIALILVSGLVLLMHRLRLGRKVLSGGYILMVQAAGSDGGRLETVLDEYAESYHALHVKKAGEETEYSFALRLKEGRRPDELTDAVKNIINVRVVDLITGKESVEY